EKWIKEKYLTRINEVKMMPEYQDKRGKWHSMDDYTLNTMVRALRDEFYTSIGKDKETGEEVERKASMATTRDKLSQIINSDFSPRIDIFKEYFKALPEAQGCEHINLLADSLTMVDPDGGETKPSELWPTYFKQWLIAAVANFHNDNECENQTMLVLIGKQNDGKTTWLNNLVPKQFNPTYRFCSGLQDPRGKDAMTLLVSMFLVNIDDQLGSITKKDADGIKNLITMPKVTIRLPYDKYTNDHPHRASLCGSLNYSGFLTDPTGNRRYLPFEVDKIDWSYLNTINIDAVWAEAYALWRAGEQFKFADDQLKQLEEHNRTFRAPSTEEDLLQTYLSPPEPWDQAGSVYMTTTDVLNYLTECVPMLRRPLNSYNIKRTMDQAGYKMKQRTHMGKDRVRVWSVMALKDNTSHAHGQPPSHADEKNGFVPGYSPADYTQTATQPAQDEYKDWNF
ncbi:MAG: hypothetical protein GY881_09745, partial [Gammaproteobacteria bacterium]|nr:hypothetical protein [Gammaproteobacteria bacterium]